MLLSNLYERTKPSTLKEITDGPNLNNAKPQQINSALNGLLHSNLIKMIGRSSYSLATTAPLYEGTLEQNPRGFGFVTTSSKPSAKPTLKKDIYISASRLGNSHHGDRVLVRVSHTKRNGRSEGIVIKILSRGPSTVAGSVIEENGDFFVYPDDPRFPFIVKIDRPEDGTVQRGDCVVVRYKVSDRPSKIQYGIITEIVGSPKTATTQMRLVIEKFHLPFQFDEPTKEEINKIDESFSDITTREDLRSTDHITIDGQDAKDFDDAICIKQIDNGYRLFVSIADVSHFVEPGSQIDKEAYLRGTSIYFPGAVIPMLPEQLSNDLCSLKPHRDRFTVSAILDFDKNAKLQNKRFCRSVIQSKYRFTYSIVSNILDTTNTETRKQYEPYIDQLELAENLADKLKQRRKQRGSVDFNLTEPLFNLTPHGEVESIGITKRTKAHQIIEEFMLAANEAVAEYFSEQCSISPYRIHESPDQEKLDQFLKFATTFDLTLPPKTEGPKFLAKILDTAKGSKYEFIFNNLLLRSLQQARYSTKNAGHFGLASPNYTHFTSPIRRYPDLLVHRLLLSILPDSASESSFQPQPSLQESCEFLSTRERQAVLAERDMNNRLKVLYMSQFIGHHFEAIISGVSENNLFIEIQDLCVSGAISIEYLTDDYYLFDAKNYRLFGEISARTYQIGDLIKVNLIEVNINRQQLHFSPVNE